jgi:ATP-dependent DNA helicase RecQ
MPNNLTTSLYTHFGFSSFRPGQEEAIQSLLAGNHTLTVMPTGAGKSLIFQLAALQFDGLTLVISPLIALMKDQVDSLTRRNIPSTYINSALPAFEQNLRLQKLAQGEYRLVYIAPERLRNVPFLNALKMQTVSLLAVDEAHCISEWGHDFRPDYLHIAQARAALGNPLTAALTATATPQVQKDIIRLLGLGDSTRIVTGFNRPNLTLDVRYASGLPSKLRALNELLSPRGSGSVIVYTGTRRDAEEVTEFAREVVKIPAEFYHAGLPAEERMRIQNDFISGKLNLIAATNAFGMGIDRADVRQVIHYSLPGSLEAYYQEAGRAGRDGLPAKAVLLYDPQDRALQEFFIASSVVSPEELRVLYHALGNVESQIWMTADDFSRRTDMHPVKIKVGLAELERVGALEHLGDDSIRMLLRKGKWDSAAIEKAAVRSREHTRHRTNQLDHMVNYAETNACRRKIILEYFGDSASPDAPICCDNCLSQKNMPEAGGDVAQMSHAERAALVILDAVRRLGNRRVGREKLAQVLKGSKAQDILKFHYDKHVYYAKLAVLKQNQIEEMISQLVSLGYFKIIGGEYPVLSLTPKGKAAIKQKAAIELKMPGGISAHSIEKKKAEMQAGGTISYTAQLLAEGLTPEKVARQRGLTLITIYGHCAKLIEASKIGVDKVVPKDVQEKIEKAIQKVSNTQYLFPIKTLLPEEITYEMIRCVVADHDSRRLTLVAKTHDAPTPNSQPLIPNSPDPITSYLSSSHPRPLTGNWHTGFALDFHSSYTGADWNRSGIGDLTYRLKYQSDSSTLPALVGHTRKLFAAHPEMGQFNLILPVPFSTPREFNPVHEFCKALSSAFNKPMQTFVTKTRQTKPQKEMHTLPQKRDNVAGAFAINGDITGKRILLMDDLFDSGATLEEITRLLGRHGARQVNVLTLTRTIHSDA